MVQHVEHRVLAIWSVGDSVVCEIKATYTRKDGQVFCLPCLDIFTIAAGKISSLRIMTDLAPVFKP
jgi:ketosteroid isomerase-like protein